MWFLRMQLCVDNFELSCLLLLLDTKKLFIICWELITGLVVLIKKKNIQLLCLFFIFFLTSTRFNWFHSAFDSIFIIWHLPTTYSGWNVNLLNIDRCISCISSSYIYFPLFIVNVYTCLCFFFVFFITKNN